MPSIIAQTFTELGDTIRDAYGHVVHGDDPGVHETLIFIARPQPTRIHNHHDDGNHTSTRTRTSKYVDKFDLGMTFVEVNDRAFVKDVRPNSRAARVGIQPQDCLQLAIDPGWKFDYDDESENYALDCERNGMRTSFDELRMMFEHCVIHTYKGNDKSQQRQQQHQMDHQSPVFLSKERSTKSLSKKLRSFNQEVVGRCASFSLNNMCTGIPPIKPAQGRPIFMVFRHTNNRHQIIRNPHVGLPSFRLDDECERAASIIRRLSPTVDTTHEEDAWDEILKGATSLLINQKNDDGHGGVTNNGGGSNNIHNMIPEDPNSVEASTIRGMIQNALGLAFVRTSKVVLGLSFHFGSGIVISRLDDGSWSAPSAIGMYGAGLGFQFGLEVADYIFVIQTTEALDHFRRGTNYTLGGHMGAAVGGIGREAFGAASLSPRNAGATDEEDRNTLAPIVAYAKSQGLYFGVSLEGSKIFVREDINHRTYQFSTGKECSTDEILSGVVPPPREAEDLYATLHSVEFAHEISQLPRPSDILQKDLHRNWQYDKDNIFSKIEDGEFIPLYFLSELSHIGFKELQQFEAKFKTFMYEGVSIQRVVPCAVGRGNDSLERRTLRLKMCEEGSLHVGFLSKATDYASGTGKEMNTYPKVVSCSGPLISTDKGKHVEGDLSRHFSMDLTNIISIERCSSTNITTTSKGDGSRLIKIQDIDGNILLFIANNTPELVVLFCGLKLLVEKETTRVGIRGGQPIGQASKPELEVDTTDEMTDEGSDGKDNDFFPIQEQVHTSNTITHTSYDEKLAVTTQVVEQENGMNRSYSNSVSSYDNSGEFDDISLRENVVPARYVQGRVLHTEIATNISIPLPLPLCRALFLDSDSPLMKKWEVDRGDFNYSYGGWNFKPTSPRGVSQLDAQDFELIATGKMTGGFRTTTFQRIRKEKLVDLSESWVVEIDEADKFVFTIAETMPRRGFSVKVTIAIRPSTERSCDVSMVGEIVPLGKNTSNQSIVHRAFLLLVKEVKDRYGRERQGLLAVLLGVYLSFNKSKKLQESGVDRRKPLQQEEKFEKDINSPGNNSMQINSFSQEHTAPVLESMNKTNMIDERNSSYQSLSDLKEPNVKVQTNSRHNKIDKHSGRTSKHNIAEGSKTPPREEKKKRDHTARPSTPAMKQRMNNQVNAPDTFRSRSIVGPLNNDFASSPEEKSDAIPIKIDVKPLPKIRLDLMPSPREIDEEFEEDSSW